MENAKQLRVAGYCRAFTNGIDMENYYSAKIKDHPEWTLVRIFTDERGARPSLERRKEFQKMLRLCRKGEIDLILTRSLTTFSRTYYDTLRIVQELQTLNIPVIFEKEGLDTSSPKAEVFIDLYAAFAKAESESLSPYICNGHPYL